MVRSFFEREFWQTVIFQSIDSSTGFNMVNVTVAKKLGADIRTQLIEWAYPAKADKSLPDYHLH